MAQVYKTRLRQTRERKDVLVCTVNTEIMQSALALSPSVTEFYFVAPEDFSQTQNSISNTIISIQYDPNKFLSFKIYEVKFGSIVRQGVEDIALQCQIRGYTYTFTREHMDQMSKRELNDLFNHLRIDGSQFC